MDSKTTKRRTGRQPANRFSEPRMNSAIRRRFGVAKPNPRSEGGFTVIELLVVITIIVVLLALLTPALDEAVYQAELAACSGSHHAAAQGALLYTSDFKRRYPYRPGVSGGTGNQPNRLNNNDPRNLCDDRPTIRNHIPLKALVCPLTQRVDLSEEANNPNTQVWASYYLWFGFQYTGEKGMFRLGDRFT